MPPWWRPWHTTWFTPRMRRGGRRTTIGVDILASVLFALLSPPAAAVEHCSPLGATRTLGAVVQRCSSVTQRVTKVVHGRHKVASTNRITWVQVGEACGVNDTRTVRDGAWAWCDAIDGQRMWRPLPDRGMAAFDSVLNAMQAVSADVAPVRVIASPGVQEKGWVVNYFKRHWGMVSALFRDAYTPISPIPAVIATNREVDWYAQQLVRVGMPQAIVDQVYARVASQAAASDSNYMTSGGFTQWELPSGGRTGVMSYVIGQNLPNFNDQQGAIIPHEWVHVVQFGTGAQYPCWFMEGAAVYYGTAVVQFSKYPDVSRRVFAAVRAQQLRDAGSYLPPSASSEGSSVAGWLSWLQQHESYNGFTCGAEGGFSLGFIATEYMLSLRGHQGILDFMTAASQPGGSWQSAVQATYGMSAEDLERAIAAYIPSVISEQQAS